MGRREGGGREGGSVMGRWEGGREGGRECDGEEGGMEGVGRGSMQKGGRDCMSIYGGMLRVCCVKGEWGEEGGGGGQCGRRVWQELESI